MADPRNSGRLRQIHAQIIADLLTEWPGSQAKGFMKALSKLPDADYMPDMHKNDRRWWQSVSFVPDVFLIVPERRHVVIFEVVVTNDVSDDKFAKIADLAWALDEDYYTLILIRCDRFSRTGYHPQMASIANAMDTMAETGTAEINHIEDWQRYTVKALAARFPEAA